MNLTRRILLGASLLAIPGLAFAQRGSNGGLVASEHGHSYELVISGALATIHLMDGNRQMPSRGASGRLVLQVEGRTVNVPLAPETPNRLTGSVPAPLAAGTRIVFSGRLADGHSLQGRFVTE